MESILGAKTKFLTKKMLTGYIKPIQSVFVVKKKNTGKPKDPFAEPSNRN